MDKILIKYERREKKKGFARYMLKTLLSREEAEGDVRGRELYYLLLTRKTRRMFDRFISHT